MSWNVLTVGREFGCGSSEVARILSERLGWRLFDRELIDEIAKVAHREPSACRHADERIDGWLQRLGTALWSGGGERGPATIPAAPLEADTMMELTRQVIQDLAAIGQCVIVGRGGNYVLQGKAGAFHLFLYARESWRARRLEGQGMEQEKAEELIHKMDHDRAAYIRRYFNQEWGHRRHYHLMLDAGMGQERTVAAALAAMGAVEKNLSAV